MTHIVYADQPATERQLGYIARLAGERYLEPPHVTWLDTVLARGINRKEASLIITHLLESPLAPAPHGQHTTTEEAPTVEPGRYALHRQQDDLNPIHFFRVKRGKDYSARGGKDWSGFLFVTRYASEEEHPVKGDTRIKVLREIAADPLTAAQLYGHELGHCCICNRALTRRISRELGIGPVCGGRLHEEFPSMVATMREQLTTQGLDPDEDVK